VSKTKDLPMDFRRSGHSSEHIIIHSQEVENVSNYNLGTIFDRKLNWDDNTDAIVKKGQQRMNFLRKLNSFFVDKKILSLFYKSYIESVVSFAFICWYNNLSVKNKNSLRRIVRICSKIIGEDLRDLKSYCNQQLVRKATAILADLSHDMSSEFHLLPSGRRFGAPTVKQIETEILLFQYSFEF